MKFVNRKMGDQEDRQAWSTLRYVPEWVGRWSGGGFTHPVSGRAAALFHLVGGLLAGEALGGRVQLHSGEAVSRGDIQGRVTSTEGGQKSCINL